METVHRNSLSILEMRSRYDEFIQDRIIRLEQTNKELSAVRDSVAQTEGKIMEKIDRNQIRSQQYVIGIVVGLIVTVLTSMIVAYLKI